MRSGDGGNITFQAAKAIHTGNIYADASAESFNTNPKVRYGGIISLSSATESINTGDITTGTFSGYGGEINLKAAGDINTSELKGGGSRGYSADINVSSSGGSIHTGNVWNPLLYGYVGNIHFDAQGSITAKDISSFVDGSGIGGDVRFVSRTGSIDLLGINTSVSGATTFYVSYIQRDTPLSGDGGSVFLAAKDNIAFGSINTRSYVAGADGAINFQTIDTSPTPDPVPVPEPDPALEPTPDPEPTPVPPSSPLANSNVGSEFPDPALLQSLQSLNQANQSSENGSSSAGELPSASLAQPEFRGKGGGRRPDKPAIDLTYDFMHDPFISQSYYELSRCPYLNALEEAEEDDFEELGSLDGESIATDSESTSDELFDSSPFSETLKLELAGGISNTEESPTDFGDASGFDLDNSTFSINPDTQLAPFSLDAGFNPYLDLSALTSEGPNWSAIQQTVSDFTQVYMEFAGGLKDGYLNSVLLGYDPHYVPTDSRFYNAGRVAGDVVSGLQGLGEILGGGGIDGLGASACATGGGCVLTGPALVAGADLIAHGIFVTGSGAINLGKDLTNFFAQENGGTGGAQTGSQGGGKSPNSSSFSTSIKGIPDKVHEGQQATHFGDLQGGGEFEFFGNSSQGIEGVFRPTKQPGVEIPVSLKSFQDVQKIGNLLKEIRRNSNQAQAVGVQNATLYGEPIQFSANQQADFALNGPLSQNIVKDGAFSRIILKGSDGIVEITQSGVKINK